MASVVDRALRLWTEPLPDADAALVAFRRVYTDPLDVNGRRTPLDVLVDRARMLQGAVEELRADVQEEFCARGRHALAFRLSGRHVGPLVTPIGELAPSGRLVSWAGMRSGGALGEPPGLRSRSSCPSLLCGARSSPGRRPMDSVRRRP